VKFELGAGASEIGVSGYEVVRDGVSVGRATGFDVYRRDSGAGSDLLLLRSEGTTPRAGVEILGCSDRLDAGATHAAPASSAAPGCPPPPPEQRLPLLWPPPPAAPTAPPATPRSQPYAAACVVPKLIGKAPSRCDAPDRSKSLSSRPASNDRVASNTSKPHRSREFRSRVPPQNRGVHESAGQSRQMTDR